MQRNNLPYESEGIFITNVISHISMLPTVRLLVGRRWSFEASISAYAISSSFMYHLTQALQAKIFYEEIDWHRVDNFGAISSFGAWLTYMACFGNPLLDQYIKYFTVFVTVFSQVAYPWEIAYTIVPILSFAMMPIVTFLIRYFNASGTPLARINQALSVYNAKHAGIGLGLLMVALFCFHLGLDENNDPYRIFHGGWHAFGGFSSYHLWQIVNKPTAEKGVFGASGLLAPNLILSEDKNSDQDESGWPKVTAMVEKESTE